MVLVEVQGIQLALFDLGHRVEDMKDFDRSQRAMLLDQVEESYEVQFVRGAFELVEELRLQPGLKSC